MENLYRSSPLDTLTEWQKVGIFVVTIGSLLPEITGNIAFEMCRENRWKVDQV